jgi:hypothetical protein
MVRILGLFVLVLVLHWELQVLGWTNGGCFMCWTWLHNCRQKGRSGGTECDNFVQGGTDTQRRENKTGAKRHPTYAQNMYFRNLV